MDVHLPQDQETRLNALAARTGRDTDDLVQEAVAKLLAYDEWFKQQVQMASTRLNGVNSSKKGKWTLA